MYERRLNAILEKARAAQSVTVAVIGDVMLDRYLYGTVSRISPEAPIPVLNYQYERKTLGGAGNVVANLCGLGANVAFFAQVGDDVEGKSLGVLLSELNGKKNGSVTFVPYCKEVTTVKTRIVGNGRQQMLRLDREVRSSLTAAQEQDILRRLEMMAGSLKVIVLSDYGKGICTYSLCQNAIAFGRRHSIPVFVDPKGLNWERYAGAEAVTPNLKELSNVAGETLAKDDDEAVIDAARRILERFKIDNILVTRSEKGCTFVDSLRTFDEPSHSVDVFDVSGAGDTFIATVAYFRTLGADWRSCCQLANLAAQIVIGKAGTYAVSFDELRQITERASRGSEPLRKTFALPDLHNKCTQWRAAGETVVFTNGCFDVFHAGHLDSLQKARALGDHLIVGLNSDASVTRLKGESRPINTQENRAQVLSGLECVDAIVIFDEDTPEKILSTLRPDILVKGGDYKNKKLSGAQYASRVVILPLVEGLSSTLLLQKMGHDEGISSSLTATAF